MTYAQAITIANIRARRTGVRQRVSLCRCRDHRLPWWRVRPVDQIPEGAL